MPLAPNTHPTIERDGRIYVAPTSSVPTVYPFAVDEAAKESQDRLHDVLKVIVGGNFIGPVEEVLIEDPNIRKSVLDLRCGSGKWIKEMAEQFPHVQFTGVDIALPSDQTAPANVRFEYGNIIEGTRFDDDSFDLVHLRAMVFSTPDFSALLAEAARILRPGGLLLSAEYSWLAQVDLPKPVPMSSHVPAFDCFVKTIGGLVRGEGMSASAEEVITLIRASGLFGDDSSVVCTIPVGECQVEEGQEEVWKIAAADGIMEIAENVRWKFKDAGWTDKQYDNLMANLGEEVRTKPGIITLFYVAFARKA